MIPVRLQWKKSPELTIGMRVPSEGILAIPEEVLPPGYEIAFDDVTVQHPAPKAVKITPKRNEAQNAFLWMGITPPGAEPQQPEREPAPPLGLLPWELHTWLYERLAKTEAIIPTLEDHPTHARLVAAAKARLATHRGLQLAPGTWNPERVVLLENIQIVVRLFGLDGAAALALLHSPLVSDDELTRLIYEARAKGVVTATAREEILEGWAHEQRAEENRRKAAEAAKRYVEEIHEYSLRDEGLVKVIRIGGMPEDTGLPWRGWWRGLQEEAIFDARGIPCAPGALGPGVSLELDGVAKMTRAERARVAPLPDDAIESIGLLRQEAAKRADNGRTYTPDSFTGSALSVEGRHALARLRLRAFQLWKVVFAVSPVSNECRYLLRTIYQLPIGFAGKVNWANSVEAIQSARRDLQTLSCTSQAHKDLIQIDTKIPREMEKALATPALYAWGELYSEPTKDDSRRIREDLEPYKFEDTLRRALGDRREVTSQHLYDALRNADLADSATPSPDLRAKVSAFLEKLGFRDKQKRTDTGRKRLWVREDDVPTADDAYASADEIGRVDLPPEAPQPEESLR